jgi:DNA-binding protein WhiA
LAKGTVSDPGKSYHFEIVTDEQKDADFLKKLMGDFGISPKSSIRRGKQVVYLKEANEIADILNVMEAPKALMNFENTRIVREVRGKINRQVNCETANINKTVTASMKQIEDIHYISSTVGIDALDENLQQIAHLRLENTEIPLSELGKLLDPPIGKSGVNHRMRKLSEIAQDLREQRGE